MVSIIFRAKLVALCLFLAAALAAQQPVPGDAKPDTPPETKPESPATPKKEESGTPQAEPVKPPGSDEAEAKRLAEEAERKKQQEIAERELAAKKAAEEAERRRAEEEKTFLSKLFDNSKLYTGLHGGLGLGLNKIHSAGPSFGMTLDYLVLKTYGFHFGVSTGQYAAKAVTLSGTNSTVNISGEGSFGFLAFDFAGVYAFSPVFGVEPAVGAGVSLYQLRGGSYDFNQRLAPLLLGSVYYNLLTHLQAGIITKLTFASASTLGPSYALEPTVGLTTLNFEVSLRYSWF